MLEKIREPNLPTTIYDLNSFGDRHKLALPARYVSFLLENNGGRPVPAAFPIQGLADNPFGIIKVFFGINTEIDTENLEYVLVEECENINVPKGILPIASTDCGDFLCIDLRKSECPIVFWDRKPSWGNNIWNEADLYPVAESFETLLETLFEFQFAP